MFPSYWRATLVLCVGLVGAVVNWIAMGTFSNTWGGPNMAAGAVQLTCYAVALGGLIWSVVGYLENRTK